MATDTNLKKHLNTTSHVHNVVESLEHYDNSLIIRELLKEKADVVSLAKSMENN